MAYLGPVQQATLTKFKLILVGHISVACVANEAGAVACRQLSLTRALHSELAQFFGRDDKGHKFCRSVDIWERDISRAVRVGMTGEIAHQGRFFSLTSLVLMTSIHIIDERDDAISYK